MSEEYTSEIIENTRRQMKSIGYENVKEGMLDSVELTRSWIQLEDLKDIMPENEYQELLKEIEMRARRTYTTEKYPEISKEELEEIIQDEIKSTYFVIANDGNNGHQIEEFSARRKDKIIKSINVKDIDGAKLAQTIAKVMQRHLDHGTFHANQYYSAEEIERALKYDIDTLKREGVVFEQDRGKVETEKEGKSSSKIEIKGSETVLDGAIKATEEKTTSSTIEEAARGVEEAAQGIGDASKGKDEKGEETEIME